MTAVALAWLNAMPGVTGPIVGPNSVAQLDDALADGGVTITEEDKKRVDGLIPRAPLPQMLLANLYAARGSVMSVAKGDRRVCANGIGSAPFPVTRPRPGHSSPINNSS